VRERQKLGQLLVNAGVVGQGVIDGILREQAADGRRLGEILVARGIVTGAVLTQVLAHQLALPWVSLAKVNPDPVLLRLVPREVAKRHRVVPVYLRRDATKATLYVAMDDPLDEAALAECRRTARISVRPMVATPDELEPAIALFYDGVAPQQAPPSTATGKDGKAEGQGPRRTISVGAMHAVVADPARRSEGAPPRPPPVPRQPPPSVRRAPEPEVHLDDADVLEEGTTPDPPSSVPTKSTAIILTVSAPLSLVRNCRMAGSALGARVVKADLANAAERARQNTPFAVVVTDTVYAFDRLGLSQLALSNGALLVIWSDELDEQYLEPLLATAHERWRVTLR
jgi:hypothetical protein